MTRLPGGWAQGGEREHYWQKGQLRQRCQDLKLHDGVRVEGGEEVGSCGWGDGQGQGNRKPVCVCVCVCVCVRAHAPCVAEVRGFSGNWEACLLRTCCVALSSC